MIDKHRLFFSPLFPYTSPYNQSFYNIFMCFIYHHLPSYATCIQTVYSHIFIDVDAYVWCLLYYCYTFNLYLKKKKQINVVSVLPFLDLKLTTYSRVCVFKTDLIQMFMWLVHTHTHTQYNIIICLPSSCFIPHFKNQSGARHQIERWLIVF